MAARDALSKPAEAESTPRRRVRPLYPEPSDEVLWAGGEHAADELICPVCRAPFRQAVTTQCGHTFCSACIQQTRERAKRCPVCRTSLTSNSGFFPSYTVRQLVDRLRCRCRFSFVADGDGWALSELGCPRRDLSVSEVEAHEAQCDFELLSCANVDEQGAACGALFRRSDAAAHEAACELRRVACRNGCGATLLERAPGHFAAHEPECGAVWAPCGVLGCFASCRRDELAAHDERAALLHAYLARRAATWAAAAAAAGVGAEAGGQAPAALRSFLNHGGPLSAGAGGRDALPRALVQALAGIAAGRCIDAATALEFFHGTRADCVMFMEQLARHVGDAEAQCAGLRCFVALLVEYRRGRPVLFRPPGNDASLLACIKPALAMIVAHPTAPAVKHAACAALQELLSAVGERLSGGLGRDSVQAHSFAGVSAAYLEAVHQPHTYTADVAVEVCLGVGCLHRLRHCAGCNGVSDALFSVPLETLRLHAAHPCASLQALQALHGFVSSPGFKLPGGSASSASWSYVTRATVRAMHAHGTHVAVASVACALLTELAVRERNGARLAEHAIAEGAADDVLHLLRAHIRDRATVIAACRCFIQLCARGAEAGGDAAARVRRGCPGAAIEAAARQHDGDTEVLDWTARALAELRKIPAWRGQLRDAVEALLAVLREPVPVTPGARAPQLLDESPEARAAAEACEALAGLFVYDAALRVHGAALGAAQVLDNLLERTDRETTFNLRSSVRLTQAALEGGRAQ